MKTEGSDPAVLDDLTGAMMFDRVCISVTSARDEPPSASAVKCINVMSGSDTEYEVRVTAIPK